MTLSFQMLFSTFRDTFSPVGVAVAPLSWSRDPSALGTSGEPNFCLHVQIRTCSTFALRPSREFDCNRTMALSLPRMFCHLY